MLQYLLGGNENSIQKGYKRSRRISDNKNQIYRSSGSDGKYNSIKRSGGSNINQKFENDNMWKKVKLVGTNKNTSNIFSIGALDNLLPTQSSSISSLTKTAKSAKKIQPENLIKPNTAKAGSISSIEIVKRYIPSIRKYLCIACNENIPLKNIVTSSS